MQLFNNNAYSRLISPLAKDSKILKLAPGTGDLFPKLSGADFFLATIYQRSGTREINWEVVKCTANVDDTLTIERGHDKTVAQQYAAGDFIELRLCAGSILPVHQGALTGALNEAPTEMLESQSIVAVGSVQTNTVSITGKNIILGFDNAPNGAFRRTKFIDTLTLRHNADSFELIGNNDIITELGDWAYWVSNGPGKWEMIGYSRASGKALNQITSKGDIGLASVDNTADKDKPVSTAHKAALDLKADKASLAKVATSGAKSDVGLGNVDNTSDANKPVSTAQAAALATKATLNGDATQNFNVASINGSFLGGMVNRIINGDMRINQRGIPSAGALAIGYTLDRWELLASVANKVTYGPKRFSVATRAPGFPEFIGFGAQVTYTAGATDYFGVQQPIEGNNLADLQYGTAAAKSCTLTAWVLSNAVGLNSGTILNTLNVKSFVFSFNIPVANTWTFICIPIPGDTVSAINVDNLRGLNVRFNLGSGSNFLAPVTGNWVAGDFVGAVGAINILASNAYLQFTGVQFEVGQATPFSRRSISEELNICQRYYCNSFPNGVAATTLAVDAADLLSSIYSNETIDSLENNGKYVIRFPASMRAAPTVTLRGYAGNATGWACQGTTASGTPTAFLGQAYNTSNKRFLISSALSARQYNIQGHWEASAEL